MKKILSVFVAFCATLTIAYAQLTAINPAELVGEAALAYEQGDYALATERYEVLVGAFNGSPDLYYALGNCYYKQQQYAKSILCYERCLQREPSHADALNNLEMAKMNCVDKIETIQPVIFVAWSNTLRDNLSANAWTILSVVLFILFLSGVACFFFVRKVEVRKVGFYSAIVMLILCGIAMAYAHVQTNRLLAHDDAIVMAPSVTVRSTPAESGTQLMVIHEGLKVHIRQELSGWYEIELSDGNVGWMKAEELEII